MTEGSIDDEFRLILASGIKYIRFVAQVFYDAFKNPISAIATAIDISEDKELLYQVKANEELFKVIADSAPITMWITDKNNRCTYVNQTWQQYTGSVPEDWLHHGWLNYIHPEDRESALQTFLKASRKAQAFELEYRIKNKNGSYGWFINRANPIFDKDGNFAGFVGCKANITAQ